MSRLEECSPLHEGGGGEGKKNMGNKCKDLTKKEECKSEWDKYCDRTDCVVYRQSRRKTERITGK